MSNSYSGVFPQGSYEVFWVVRYSSDIAEVYSSPAVVDGVVYVGSGDAKIYALAAETGELVCWPCNSNSFFWEFEILKDLLPLQNCKFHPKSKFPP